jgi:hypothetical protein
METDTNNEIIVIERLKFYADTDTVKNKHFCFTINSILDLEKRLLYWMQRVEVRAAWYECLENGKSVSNQRIDLISFIDTHEILFHKE